MYESMLKCNIILRQGIACIQFVFTKCYKLFQTPSMNKYKSLMLFLAFLAPESIV